MIFASSCSVLAYLWKHDIYYDIYLWITYEDFVQHYSIIKLIITVMKDRDIMLNNLMIILMGVGIQAIIFFFVIKPTLNFFLPMEIIDGRKRKMID